jgi:pyruvate/2-oxoglutarate dehydrogenase complex dihydrolipoamide acyltransferase (E2) component
MHKIYVPKENVNDSSVLVIKVHYQNGDFVEHGDLVILLETTKTVIEISSPASGYITLAVNEGVEVPVKALLFEVNEFEQTKNISGQENIKSSSLGLVISKAAREASEKFGVNLEGFSDEWVTKSKIEKIAGLPFQDEAKQLNDDEIIEQNLPSTLLRFSKEGIAKRKKSEIKSLDIGLANGLTSTIGIDIRIDSTRSINNDYIFSDGISDLVVFEASRLLKKYPKLNAFCINKDEIGLYDSVNVGWSFDDGENLKVISIENSDLLPLKKLQEEILEIYGLYDSGGAIPLEKLVSSTFTFSDLSGSQATFMLPLLNGLQSLILGLCKKSSSEYSLFATFDHRLTEGLYTSRFLSELREKILEHFFDDVASKLNIKCFFCENLLRNEMSLGSKGFLMLRVADGSYRDVCRNCYEGL